MSAASHGRRRSDDAGFIETDVDVNDLADRIFAQYSGPQHIVTDGVPGTATFFDRDYCPDYRVMKLAGALALAVNRRSVGRGPEDAEPLPPLRVTLREIMVAALLHDVGKQHEDCAPFLERMRHVDLRGDSAADAERRNYLLGIVRDIHCRKGPCMLDRLRDGGHRELHNPFIATVARRHGDDYQVNRTACWWPREINVITIADDYDAMMSSGPERAYKAKTTTRDEAIDRLREGAHWGRYERQLTSIFIADVLSQSQP